MQLRNVNLNHLVTLRELLRTASVTKAAASLGLTQSTVSGTLTQLRSAFDDELLVMAGRHMKLTARALTLASSLEQLLSDAEALYVAPVFVPEEAQGSFVLGTALPTLVPPLISRLSETAPGIQLTAISPDAASLRRLRTGSMDLLVAPPGEENASDICTARLHEDRLVCIASSANKNVPEVLDLETYQRLPMASYWPGASHPDVAHRLLASELPRRGPPAVRVPTLALLPLIVTTSPFIAVLPLRLVELSFPMTSLRIVETAFDLPTFCLNMYWSNQTDSSPLHAYVRSVLADIGRDIEG